MKKTNLILGIIFIILGLFVSIGPYTIFHVCSGSMEMEGSAMHGMSACQKTALAELVLGIIIAILGLVNILIKTDLVKKIANIGNLILGILVLSFVTFITGTCQDVRMHCNMATKPALIILGVLVILAGLVGTILSFKKSEEAIYEEIEQEIKDEDDVFQK